MKVPKTLYSYFSNYDSHIVIYASQFLFPNALLSSFFPLLLVLRVDIYVMYVNTTPSAFSLYSPTINFQFNPHVSAINSHRSLIFETPATGSVFSRDITCNSFFFFLDVNHFLVRDSIIPRNHLSPYSSSSLLKSFLFILSYSLLTLYYMPQSVFHEKSAPMSAFLDPFYYRSARW